MLVPGPRELARRVAPLTLWSLLVHAPVLAWLCLLVAGVVPPWSATGLVLALVSAALEPIVAGLAIDRSAAWRQLGRLATIGVISALAAALGMVAFVVPGALIMTALWLAAPACVAEHLSVGASLGRSLELVKRAPWQSFLIVLTLAVMLWANDKLLSWLDPRFRLGPWPHALVPAVGVVVITALRAAVSASAYRRLAGARAPE